MDETGKLQESFLNQLEFEDGLCSFSVPVPNSTENGSGEIRSSMVAASLLQAQFQSICLPCRMFVAQSCHSRFSSGW